MRLSLSTYLFAPRALDPSWLPQIREAGFDAIEIWAQPQHFPYRDPAASAHWKSLFAAAGLEPATMQLPGGLPVFSSDPAQREHAMLEIELAIDAAEVLGSRLVILPLGAPHETELPDHPTYAEDAIARLSGYASPRGLELACENLNSSITRVPRLATAIENVGRSMVGICVDVATAHSEGDITEAFRAAGRELYHIQMSDSNSSGASQLPVGHGTIPWSGVIGALKELRYEGLLALEVRDTSDGKASIQELLTIARDSAEKLRAAGA